MISDYPFHNFGVPILSASVAIAAISLLLGSLHAIFWRIFLGATFGGAAYILTHGLLYKIFGNDSVVFFATGAIVYLTVFYRALGWSLSEHLIKAAAIVYSVWRPIWRRLRSQDISQKKRWITVAGDNRASKFHQKSGIPAHKSGQEGSAPDKVQASPLTTRGEKGVIQHTADNIRERVKLKFDIRIEKVKTELLQTYRERLEETRRVWEAEASASQEEKEEIGEQSRHEREIAQRRREAEKLQQDIEIAQSKKKIEELEREPEPEPSEEEKLLQQLDNEIKWEEIHTMKEWERRDAIHRARKQLLKENPERVEEIEDFIHQKEQEILRRSFEAESEKEPEDH